MPLAFYWLPQLAIFSLRLTDWRASRLREHVARLLLEFSSCLRKRDWPWGGGSRFSLAVGQQEPRPL